MRYYEIASGIRIPVSSEEQELLDRITKKGFFCKKDFSDERDEEVARLMLSRGVLSQIKKNDELCYKPNSVNDIWRDRNG
jgi:hypothetical protein